MSKISDYQTGDATGLAKIGGEAFTITAVKDSSYDGKPSIIITTQKRIKVEGKEFNNFYTSRKAVMDTLSSKELRDNLQDGKPVGPVKCVLKKPVGDGKDYWVLVDA